MRRVAPLTVMLLAPVAARADEQQGVDFFEKRVRPLLITRCYDCHSAQAGKSKGQLSLDSREGLLRGGESGPAIVPGHPDKSLLIRAIRYTDDDLEMPPKEKGRLAPDQVTDLVAWVKMGAPDPRATPDSAAPVAKAIDFEAARRFWSLRPVGDAAPPPVRNTRWPAGPVDRFVLARLEEKGLHPVADASRRTLIRRATFDLTGLPPSEEEIDAFLADEAPDAFARLVDRLLASPAYGERWGRHWLDLVRYADTAGDNSDFPIPQAYRYRNYVIDAFNHDKPYDQLIREQIAGDLLPGGTADEARERLIATGYLAISRRFGSQVKDYPQHLTIEDTIDNLGRTFLGLTVNCARCHDHKFDPITSQDYYALYGILQSTRYPFPGIEVAQAQKDLVPLVPAAEVDRLLKPFRVELATYEDRLKSRKAAVEAEQPRVKALAEEAAAARKTFQAAQARAGAIPLSVGRAPDLASQKAPAELDAHPALRQRFEEVEAALAQARRTQAFAQGEVGRLEAEKASFMGLVEQARRLAELEARVSAAREHLQDLVRQQNATEKELGRFQKQQPLIDSAYAVAEGRERRNARVQIRGEPGQSGIEVPRRFLQVLGGQTLPGDDGGSGRRALGDWIADPRNPLTARVMVNRLWQHHFGRGIVATPGDFGIRGARPSHPELLDWLARRFVDGGWSIKAMHRLMMLSRTYQLDSVGRIEQARLDPGNELLWKATPRRLEAESIRDAMMAVSGTLDRAAGEGHPFPPPSEWTFTQHVPFIAVYPSNKRSVYLMVQRIRRHPFFALFDGPEGNAATSERRTSTTPLQGLYLFNDPFVHEQAAAFARRLLHERPDDAGRVAHAYLLAFGRPPSDDEQRTALRYLARLGAKPSPGEDGARAAWESYARVLFRLNEFVYVD